jgi:hypothetical protein
MTKRTNKDRGQNATSDASSTSKLDHTTAPVQHGSDISLDRACPLAGFQ